LPHPILTRQQFGIEAIRLVDHFQFRDKSNKANKVSDLELRIDSSWADSYFTDGNMLCKQRLLFIKEQ
jgi:hypothetical protein